MNKKIFTKEKEYLHQGFHLSSIVLNYANFKTMIKTMTGENLDFILFLTHQHSFIIYIKKYI